MKLVPRFRKQWFAYLTVLCLALAAAVSFGVPAKAAENPQTSVSNTGKEADATKNQTSKADQVSAPYEGTGKTSKSLYGGQTELEKTFKPYSLRALSELMNAPESPARHLFHIEQPFNCQSSIPTLQALMDVPDF